MANTYSPAAGTVAARVVAWLQARPTGEYNAAQIAEALQIDPKIMASSLEQALREKLVFHRQCDRTSQRAPWWYSATDHAAHQRRNGFGQSSAWMAPPKKDAAPEAAAHTPQGDQPRSERGREVMEPAVCESADGRGTTGAPALATLPQQASPGVGPMGAGQPADAGPTCEDDEQPREVDAQFAATLRAAMDFDDDHLPPADLAATRRAVHAPRVGLVPLAFRAGRFSDGSLHLERDGAVIASLSAAEVDVVVQLLGARAS